MIKLNRKKSLLHSENELNSNVISQSSHPLHIFFQLDSGNKGLTDCLVAFLDPENYGLYEALTRYFNE